MVSYVQFAIKYILSQVWYLFVSIPDLCCLTMMCPARKPLLTLIRPTECSIKFNTIKSGWSIVHIEGLQAVIFKNIYFFL